MSCESHFCTTARPHCCCSPVLNRNYLMCCLWSFHINNFVIAFLTEIKSAFDNVKNLLRLIWQIILFHYFPVQAEECFHFPWPVIVRLPNSYACIPSEKERHPVINSFLCSFTEVALLKLLAASSQLCSCRSKHFSLHGSPIFFAKYWLRL